MRRLMVCVLAMSAWAGVAAAASVNDLARQIDSGARIFKRSCALCHQAPNMGYFMLSRRLGEAQADLASRTDLVDVYVRVVVRNGLNGMPPLSRGELSDPEMEAVIAYLQRPRAATGVAP